MKNILLSIFLSAYVLTAQGRADEAKGLPVDVSAEDSASLAAAKEVYYRDFGAKGDGQTDDIDAIAAAHAFANQNDLPVRADDQATYYIGSKERTVNIRTDTNFGTASFIIDDTKVENRGAPVFRVSSGIQPFELETISSLKKNQKKIDVSLPGPSLIRVVNTNVKQYIRLGSNQDNGSSQSDIFLVDKDGNVDPSIPIIWDFDQITTITALPIGKKENTLTITGGRFTTVANRDASEYNYYDRNFEIARSHVVVDGMKHDVTGEGDQGAPYAGFINIYNCAYVTVKNTTLTGHKTYYTIGSAGTSVPMGTYDISVGHALNVSFVNCDQTNDINDRQYWGIMGSNYCKNLLYDGCTLSRFDAHRGVNNATIRNSTLGHMGINAIGSGTFTVENTTIRGNNLIYLRADYGSTWQGELIIRDCVFVPNDGRSTNAALIGGYNSSKHDFGYTCYLPERIIIENLQIEDANHPEGYPGPAILADFNPELTDESYQEDFPYVRSGEVILDNVTTASGKDLRLSDNSFMFKDVVVTYRQDDPEPTTAEVIVRAQGSTGEERIVLLADGVAQGEAITLSTTMADYSWSVEASYTNLEVQFANDGRSAKGTDKNVRVDYMIVAADTLQAEAQRINTGSYSSQGGCGSGGSSEWLYCQGHITFDLNSGIAAVIASPGAGGLWSSNPSLDLQVYPNPSQEQVWVHLPTGLFSGKVDWQVVDMSSRPVRSGSSQTARWPLPTQGLAPGTYLVKVRQQKQQWTERLLIE